MKMNYIGQVFAKEFLQMKKLSDKVWDVLSTVAMIRFQDLYACISAYPYISMITHKQFI